MIELSHLCKRFAGATRDSVRDLSLTAAKGEFIMESGSKRL